MYATGEITPASPSNSDGSDPGAQYATSAAGRSSAAPRAEGHPVQGQDATASSVVRPALKTIELLPQEDIESDIDDDPFAGYVLRHSWSDDSPRPLGRYSEDGLQSGPAYELGNSSFDSFEMSRVPWLQKAAQGAPTTAGHTTTILPPTISAVVPVSTPPNDDSDIDDDPFARHQNHQHLDHHYWESRQPHISKAPLLQPPPLSRLRKQQHQQHPQMDPRVAPAAATASRADSVSPDGSPGGVQAPASTTTAGTSPRTDFRASSRRSSSSDESDPFAGYVPEPSPLGEEEYSEGLLGGAGIFPQLDGPDVADSDEVSEREFMHTFEQRKTITSGIRQGDAAEGSAVLPQPQAEAADGALGAAAAAAVKSAAAVKPAEATAEAAAAEAEAEAATAAESAAEAEAAAAEAASAAAEAAEAVAAEAASAAASTGADAAADAAQDTIVGTGAKPEAGAMLGVSVSGEEAPESDAPAAVPSGDPGDVDVGTGPAYDRDDPPGELAAADLPTGCLTHEPATLSLAPDQDGTAAAATAVAAAVAAAEPSESVSCGAVAGADTGAQPRLACSFAGAEVGTSLEHRVMVGEGEEEEELRPHEMGEAGPEGAGSWEAGPGEADAVEDSGGTCASGDVERERRDGDDEPSGRGGAVSAPGGSGSDGADADASEAAAPGSADEAAAGHCAEEPSGCGASPATAEVNDGAPAAEEVAGPADAPIAPAPAAAAGGPEADGAEGHEGAALPPESKATGAEQEQGEAPESQAAVSPDPPGRHPVGVVLVQVQVPSPQSGGTPLPQQHDEAVAQPAVSAVSPVLASGPIEGTRAEEAQVRAGNPGAEAAVETPGEQLQLQGAASEAELRDAAAREATQATRTVRSEDLGLTSGQVGLEEPAPVAEAPPAAAAEQRAGAKRESTGAEDAEVGATSGTVVKEGRAATDAPAPAPAPAPESEAAGPAAQKVAAAKTMPDSGAVRAQKDKGVDASVSAVAVKLSGIHAAPITPHSASATATDADSAAAAATMAVSGPSAATAPAIRSSNAVQEAAPGVPMEARRPGRKDSSAGDGASLGHGGAAGVTIPVNLCEAAADLATQEGVALAERPGTPAGDGPPMAPAAAAPPPPPTPTPRQPGAADGEGGSSRRASQASGRRSSHRASSSKHDSPRSATPEQSLALVPGGSARAAVKALRRSTSNDLLPQPPLDQSSPREPQLPSVVEAKEVRTEFGPQSGPGKVQGQSSGPAEAMALAGTGPERASRAGGVGSVAVKAVDSRETPMKTGSEGALRSWETGNPARSFTMSSSPGPDSSEPIASTGTVVATAGTTGAVGAARRRRQDRSSGGGSGGSGGSKPARPGALPRNQAPMASDASPAPAVTVSPPPPAAAGDTTEAPSWRTSLMGGIGYKIGSGKQLVASACRSATECGACGASGAGSACSCSRRGNSRRQSSSSSHPHTSIRVLTASPAVAAAPPRPVLAALPAAAPPTTAAAETASPGEHCRRRSARTTSGAYEMSRVSSATAPAASVTAAAAAAATAVWAATVQKGEAQPQAAPSGLPPGRGRPRPSRSSSDAVSRMPQLSAGQPRPEVPQAAAPTSTSPRSSNQAVPAACRANEAATAAAASSVATAADAAAPQRQGSTGGGGVGAGARHFDSSSGGAFLACPQVWLRHLALPHPPSHPPSPAGSRLRTSGLSNGALRRPSCGSGSGSGSELMSSEPSVGAVSSSTLVSPYPCRTQRHDNGLPSRQRNGTLPGLPLLSELAKRYPLRRAPARGPEIALVAGHLYVSDRVRMSIAASGRRAAAAAGDKGAYGAKLAASKPENLSDVGLPPSAPASPCYRALSASERAAPGGRTDFAVGVGEGGRASGSGSSYLECRRAEKALRASLTGLQPPPPQQQQQHDAAPAVAGAGTGARPPEDRGWVWGLSSLFTRGATGASGLRTDGIAAYRAGGAPAAPGGHSFSAADAGAGAGSGGIAGGGGDRHARLERWLEATSTALPEPMRESLQPGQRARPATALGPPPLGARVPGLWSLPGVVTGPSKGPAAAVVVPQRRTEGCIGILERGATGGLGVAASRPSQPPASPVPPAAWTPGSNSVLGSAAAAMAATAAVVAAGTSVAGSQSTTARRRAASFV